MEKKEPDYKLYSAKDLKTGENKLIKVPVSFKAYYLVNYAKIRKENFLKQLDELEPMIGDAITNLEKWKDDCDREIRMIDLKIAFLLLFPVFLLIMGILLQGG